MAADVRKLAAEMERIHPDLYHSVSRERFQQAVDDLVEQLADLERDEILVELLRIIAMTGERDGHMGLFPLVDHRRPVHLAPIRAWVFPEGFYVVASPERPELVGTRIVAIEGRPVDEVAALVRPLVTRDNESSLILRLPEFMITGEILHGLGLVSERGHGAADGRARRRRASRCDALDASRTRVLESHPARLGAAASAGRANAALASRPEPSLAVREAGARTRRLRRLRAHELDGHLRGESPHASAVIRRSSV